MQVIIGYLLARGFSLAPFADLGCISNWKELPSHALWLS